MSDTTRRSYVTAKIDIIHHAGLITADLDGVIKQYERLGFFFGPLSLVKITLSADEDPVYIGLGNRTAIFQRNYLEIVGIPDPDIWAKFPVEKRGPFNIDERLPLYDGMHIMHFGTDEIEALREDYIARRQAISDVARLQRMVDTPDGPRLMQAKAISYPRADNPEGLIQVAQHVTPEYVLQPRYMHHPNGALGMTEVVVCSRSPEPLAEKYSGYTGHPVTKGGDRLVIDLGHTRIVIVDPAGLARLSPGYSKPVESFLAGFTIAVADLDETRAHLSGQGVSFDEIEGRIVVPPAEGCGSAVVFSAS